MLNFPSLEDFILKDETRNESDIFISMRKEFCSHLDTLQQWFSNCASRRPGASFQFSKGVAEYFGFVPSRLGFIASKEL